jgi:non-ribosomal peptide synthetase component F
LIFQSGNWGASCGGRLIVVPHQVPLADAFCELLSQEQVTVLNQTPAN